LGHGSCGGWRPGWPEWVGGRRSRAHGTAIRGPLGGSTGLSQPRSPHADHLIAGGCRPPVIGGLYHLVAAAGHTLGWECGGTARAHGGVVVSAAFSGAPPSVTIRNRSLGGAFKVTTSLQASCAGGQLKVVKANVAALAPTDEPIPVASNAAAKYQVRGNLLSGHRGHAALVPLRREVSLLGVRGGTCACRVATDSLASGQDP